MKKMACGMFFLIGGGFIGAVLGANVGGHEKLPSDGHESARWR